MSKKTEGECCPQFNPTPWNEKTFTWKEKKFIKDNVFTDKPYSFFVTDENMNTIKSWDY